jgi:hypothetical protein
LAAELRLLVLWGVVVQASVVVGGGHGPVDAVVVSDAGVPGEGLAAVVSAAKRIHVSAGCAALWHWFVMIKSQRSVGTVQVG